MEVTVRVTKVAWIRDARYPQGVTAPGHFNCLCGLKIDGIQYGQTGEVRCIGCDRVYDGYGHVKQPKEG